MSSEKSFAVVCTGGKQYIVKPGQKIKVEKLEVEPGAQVDLDKVLLVQDTTTGLKIGNPFVSGAVVKTKVVQHTKDKKVVAFKKRRRKGWKLKKGHRQQKVELLVESISA